MSYEDFWFIDTRVQTRNLRRWLIWFILLFAFVTIGSIMAIKTMYKDINIYAIQESSLDIKVNEAKATNVNGYIKGKIKNNYNETINGKYLCFLLYNENNDLKGTEYIEIGTLKTGETKSYELKFKKDNINRFCVLVTEEKI